MKWNNVENIDPLEYLNLIVLKERFPNNLISLYSNK